MVEGLTPVPPAREYPEFTEDGIRELWMGLDVKELTWESFHRAAIRSMPHEERDKIVGLFKDKGGEYKSRRPTMVEFIEVVLSIEWLGRWEFDRQDEFPMFVRNLENRVELAKLLDGETDYVG
eukprot:TRINITY_DN8392_c0_g1_i1.p1 TRINITY_DN8392_c0_g1~~TRINITY_DN8392_c0_g1_i1.p1  ORF type:complete len:123 (-),score=27.79 TRINITY_DN8392_c0_g1_i1:287-655(-)